MPALIEDYEMFATDFSSYTAGLRFFATIPGAVAYPHGVRSVCMREKIKMRWWCLWGGFSNLEVQKLNKIEARLGLADTDPENKVQVNQPRQPTSHSAPHHDPQLS
tara:strand:+ start:157 stop:474 length:318 start_codon:yes stop_codon:yes gene_type:complete